MRYVVVSIFDKAAAAYSRPFFVPAIGQAIRVFTDEISREAEDNPMFRHPSDFELWHVAHFDDSTGQFDNASPAYQLATGAAVVSSRGGV